MPDAAQPNAPQPDDPVHLRPDGLSLTSLTLGVVGGIIAAGCWGAWLLIIAPRQWQAGYNGDVPLITLAIGALWAAMVPVSALAILYGCIRARRTRERTSESPGLARAGIVTGIVALLVALTGAAFFALSLAHSHPPEVIVPISPPTK